MALICLGILLAGNSCFAQPTYSPTFNLAESNLKVFTGTVKMVTVANPEIGTRSEIVAVDKGGKMIIFLVKSTTTIYDRDAKSISLDEVTKEREIIVKYSTTKEGVNVATSMYLM